MKKYESVPIGQLVSDVAVDPVHVRELADSIKVSGPICPVLVREETSELIDGFHRVAAMKELGFDSVECIVTGCDDEVFWDLRIMSATLHKAVTFARAVDWIDECFVSSSLRGRYKSAYSAFAATRQGKAPKDVQDWVENKVQKWGLTVRTIEDWLYTKQTLEPDVLAEARGNPPEADTLSVRHYRAVASGLPQNPELQRPLVEKAKQEQLTAMQIEQVAEALRHADDAGEVQTILSSPVTRPAEELLRAAKVEKLLREPTVTPPPTERRQELTGLALEVFLDLQQQVHNVKRLRSEVLDTLSPSQKDELIQVVDDLMAELQRIADSLRGVTEARLIRGGEP